MTLKLPSIIVSNMRILSPLLGILLIIVVAGCKMPANVDEYIATITPPTQSPPISPPTETPSPTKTPTPTPIPGAYIESGERALFNGDFEQALQEFRTALDATIEPEVRSAARMGIARSWLLGRNYYEAAKVLEQMIRDDPESPHLADANFLLAQAQSMLDHHSEAADAYLNYLALKPGTIDAYVLDLRGDSLFAAGDYGGAALDYQAALLSPSLLDEVSIQMKLARSLAISGDNQTALALYDDIYNRTSDDNTRALIDLRKGQIYTSLGQVDAARESYLDAVNNYPTSYESYTALIELVDAGVPVDELKRGIVDYYAGQYGVALAALDRYLQDNPSDPGTALYFYGLTTHALGGHQEAIEKWDQLIKNFPDHQFWDEAWEQKAYTQWYFLEEYSEAIQTLLEFAESVPAHPRAAEFLFDAAYVAERSGDIERAAEYWERLYNLYPSDEQSQRALFLSGISRYRLGDYANAENVLERMLSNATNLEDRSAALLWIGKTKAARGDLDDANKTWETAAGVDPTGYYSERALGLLHNQTPFTPPEQFDLVFDERKEKARAESWMRAAFGLSEDTDMSGLGALVEDVHFQRGSELWRLGMHQKARSEFEQLRQSIAADAVQTYQLANYLAEIGIYRSAILAARQVLDLAMMDDAETMSAPPYFNYLRFGAYYDDLILPTSQDYGFHPLFLFSIVRQESMFESFIRSPAGANGLMQIIPSTGEDIAANLGWPMNYSTEDLNRPNVSVILGTDYLDRQRNLFEGDLYAVLSAYNAGPGNAQIWYEIAADDPDVFVEVVRYAETREYIRSIFEIFNIYKRLYDRTP